MPNKPASPCTYCGQPAIHRGRCARHARPGTAARGYAAPHKRRRNADALAVKQGRGICWRCKTPIHPSEEWDLGHDDHDRSLYRGPEHQHCNRSEAAKRRQAGH